MLPSKALKDLSKSVDICLSGKTAPEGCDIRYRQNYWLMVFDAKGELVAACDLGKELTRGKKKRQAIPDTFSAFVERALKDGQSLESFERRYVAERGSDASHAALVAKVESMDRVGQMRVVSFLERVANQTDDPVRSRVRGIQLNAAACNRQVINHGALLSLRESIESFIAERPEHPACHELIEPLCDVALKYSFDLPARCEAYAAAWNSGPHPDAAARSARAMLSSALLRHCESEVTRGSAKLEEMDEGEYGLAKELARLGEAKRLLDVLATTKSFGVMKPIHAEWRKNARAKLGGL